MSFKIKKWTHYRTVTLTDLIPGLQGSGATPYYYDSGFAMPWQGKIICACYDADYKSVWVIYDPATNTAEGPFMGPDEGARPWIHYSPFYGNSTYYSYWGDQFLVGEPGEIGYGLGAPTFWGWDTSFNFWQADYGLPPHGGLDSSAASCMGLGTDGSVPSVMILRTWGWGGTYGEEWGKITYGGGYTTLMEGYGVIYVPTMFGSRMLHHRMLGDHCLGWWRYGDNQTKQVIWSQIPTVAGADEWLVDGTFGIWGMTGDPMTMEFGLGPGGAVIKSTVGGVESWPLATDPLGGGERPWASLWEYYSQIHGGYPLDELDLDGVDHTAPYPNPAGRTPRSMGTSGWYYALSSSGPINFEVLVLDPWQPGGMARTSAPRVPGGALGWMGDYALGTDLCLAHVQPFPDDRAPEGSGVHPPQERTDGLVIGRKELFRGAVGDLKYVRDLSTDLSSYPHGGDWWFPGEVGTRYPGFWNMFAGVGPTVLGYMPDPSWGMINPMGQPCSRLLGVTSENLRAVEPAPTHVVREDLTLTDAPWAAPLTGVQSDQRWQLISGLDGQTFVYSASGTVFGGPPAWKVVAGTVRGTTWQTTVDFSDVDLPGLGETGWTVWSAVPIQPCRPLPKGGFLVGATLYFAPWEEDNWDWDPGPRDATFMETGNGWVPAKLGYDGPLNNDEHRPNYLVAYDEWTANRSLYGPDALLIFDNLGHFVGCLNSLDLHAPNGKEVMVTRGTIPKLIFRIYRHGTYSDFAEGFGLYHKLGSNEEIQAPLYAVYDLLTADGRIAPGAGAFNGFIDMYAIGDYAPQDSAWRWDSVAPTLYDWMYPKSLWSPPGGSYVRSGRGGGGLTPLAPGQSSTQIGVRGIGSKNNR